MKIYHIGKKLDDLAKKFLGDDFFTNLKNKYKNGLWLNPRDELMSFIEDEPINSIFSFESFLKKLTESENYESHFKYFSEKKITDFILRRSYNITYKFGINVDLLEYEVITNNNNVNYIFIAYDISYYDKEYYCSNERCKNNNFAFPSTKNQLDINPRLGNGFVRYDIIPSNHKDDCEDYINYFNYFFDIHILNKVKITKYYEEYTKQFQFLVTNYKIKKL